MTDTSVLLSFHAENVYSFRDEVEFSMVAADRAEDMPLPREITPAGCDKPIDVLPVAGLFGANASGKTNLLKAMSAMRRAVVESFAKKDPGGRFRRVPFMLDPAAIERPSSYEVNLVVCGSRYNYGYVADSHSVQEEWAYRYVDDEPELVFERATGRIDSPDHLKQANDDVERILRPNALFLSAAGATGHAELTPLFDWFEQGLRLLEPSARHDFPITTTDAVTEDAYRSRIVRLIRAADVGIVDVRKDSLPSGIEAMESERGDGSEQFAQAYDRLMEQLKVEFMHKAVGEPIGMRRPVESRGTISWFDLIAPILWTLDCGSCLLIDEIDASLHPMLLAELIELFQDVRSNPKHAQIIFTCHAPLLLPGSESHQPLRRDQVWYASKNTDSGASSLIPLWDYRPRVGEAVSRRYLRGNYGAVPCVDHFEMAQTIAL